MGRLITMEQTPSSGTMVEKRKRKRKRDALHQTRSNPCSSGNGDSTSREKIHKKKKKKPRKIKRQTVNCFNVANTQASAEAENRSILEWVEMNLNHHGFPNNGCSTDQYSPLEVSPPSHLAAHNSVDADQQALARTTARGNVERNAHGNGHASSHEAKHRAFEFDNQTGPCNGHAFGCKADAAPCQSHVQVCQDADQLRPSGDGKTPALVKSHTNGAKKQKCEHDRVLHYLMKRSVVVKSFGSFKVRTDQTVVIAWGKYIPVTITSEASAVQEWIGKQDGFLFGLDVEWKPNRSKNMKNKVALLQLSGAKECLIVQMLFLDRIPDALVQLLSDPSKSLAGVGVHGDAKRLLQDHGLECQGGLELTTLAVEQLNREELRHVGLKVLVREVLGLRMDKPKRVTMSNWATRQLSRAQIEYACIDAWASFAVSQKLLNQNWQLQS